MHRASFRALAIAATAVAFVAAVSPTSGPAAALASAQTPDFVFQAFPHDSVDVGFSNSWGARRSGGRGHTGTDIISPRGTEIVAVADGIVTAMGKSGISGYFIRLDHGGGWTTAYIHLNNDTAGTDDGDGGSWTAFHPTLMEGDRVVAGQVIGYVGDSGNAEGTIPHTHFAIKFEGRRLNPYDYLRDVWERDYPELEATHRGELWDHQQRLEAVREAQSDGSEASE